MNFIEIRIHLVVLYGPPAVGKLTVAKELAKLTGYRVFHNHMTVDFLDVVFGYGTPGFFRLLAELRVHIIEAAAKTALPGLIFTFVYANPSDDPFMRRLTRAMKKNGGSIHFVRLHCTKNELYRRVTRTSRRRFGKMLTVKQLDRDLKEADLRSEFSAPGGLSIDTTTLSPRIAAQNIVQKLGLAERQSK